MYPYLSPGVAGRTLTAGDLAVIDSDASNAPEPLMAAPSGFSPPAGLPGAPLAGLAKPAEGGVQDMSLSQLLLPGAYGNSSLVSDARSFGAFSGVQGLRDLPPTFGQNSGMLTRLERPTRSASFAGQAGSRQGDSFFVAASTGFSPGLLGPVSGATSARDAAFSDWGVQSPLASGTSAGPGDLLSGVGRASASFESLLAGEDDSACPRDSFADEGQAAWPGAEETVGVAAAFAAGLAALLQGDRAGQVERSGDRKRLSLRS